VEDIGNISGQVRQHIAVPGHAAFPSSLVYSLQADMDGQCTNVLSKVKTMIEANIQQEDMRGGDVHDEEIKAAADIESGVTGVKVLREIEDALGNANLSSALKAGHVITVNDMDDIVECETGKPSHLEQNNETESGLALVQGDMIIPDDDSEASSFLEHVWQGTRWAGRLWKYNKVYYCFRRNTHTEAKKSILKAIGHIETSTCVRFIEVTASNSEDSCRHDGPSILVQSLEAGACWSNVGIVKEGNQNKLNLGEGCWALGIAAHEIGHSIGMAHEQSRPDRDRYVTIHWDNIQFGKEHNFKKNKDAYRPDGYDFLSLMHYGSFDFAKNRRKPTISAGSQRDNQRMGQRNSFSTEDLEQINKMYPCKPPKPIAGSQDWWSCNHDRMHTCSKGAKCCCDSSYTYYFDRGECLT